MAALRSRRPAGGPGGGAVPAGPGGGAAPAPPPRRSPRCSELAPSRGPILGASRNKGGAVMGDRVGFIGLGAMGRPMARHLLQAGFPLVVHSRSPGPGGGLGGGGGGGG